MPKIGVRLDQLEFYLWEFMFRKNILKNSIHKNGSTEYFAEYLSYLVSSFPPGYNKNTPVHGPRLELMEHFYLIEDILRSGATFRGSGYIVSFTNGVANAVLEPSEAIGEDGEVFLEYYSNSSSSDDNCDDLDDLNYTE